MIEFFKYRNTDENFVFVKETTRQIEDYTVNRDYSVKINGREIDCYNVRVSKMPFNRMWPGHQRDINQSEIAAMVQLSGDEILNFEVKAKKEFSKCVIRPLSKKITPIVRDGIISFTIEKNGYYILELDDFHNCLHIFYNKINEYNGKEDATYCFGPGFHFPGTINLKSGESVYIDKDAYVFGSLFGKDVKNIRIFGYGILDGSCEERVIDHCYEEFTKGNIRFYGSKNISVEGIVLKDSAIWCLSCFACKEVKIKDIKIVGQWRYNTDGIDICNCEDVSIENCFIRSFDDTISIKGIDGYRGNYPINIKWNKNIKVSNCVLWCGWGRTLEIGLETSCRYYDDILFEDCDLIHNSAVCLDIQAGDCAVIQNVTFKNIRIEYQKDTLPEIFQRSDDQIYDNRGKTGMPALIGIIGARYRDTSTYKEWFPERVTGGSYSDIIFVKNILYKDIYVFLEEGLPLPQIMLTSTVNDTSYQDIVIENLFINGNKAKSLSDINLNVEGQIDYNIQVK